MGNLTNMKPMLICYLAPDCVLQYVHNMKSPFMVQNRGKKIIKVWLDSRGHFRTSIANKKIKVL